ncbi:hypothetical protein VTK56DRAFT_2970 [Thermocarpiscus australiensis]
MLTTLILILPLAVLIFRGQSRNNKTKRPPRLDETIPFVSNIWQFMTNKRLFINRARKALENSPVVRCRLGPLDLHLVGGGSNVSAIFRASCHSDAYVLRIMQSAGYRPADLAKLSRDDSGSGSTPRPGSSAAAAAAGLLAPERRIWYALHRMYDETLVSARSTDVFANLFQDLFYQHAVAASRVGEWVEDVHVFDFLKRTMTTAATHATLGPLIMDVNPGFVDAFWQYERHVEALAFGLPDWLNRPAVRARQRFTGMCRTWYEIAERRYDWSAENDADWEPVFGSRLSRGLARWAKTFDFSAGSMGPAFILLLFGLHANTIPVCTWVVMELIKDPDLFRAVKEEIKRAETSQDGSDSRVLDNRKLSSLPLLQSVYTEVLRLHVGLLITRTCTEPVTIGGYTLPKGSIFQAPTEVGHLDEAVWSTPDHPASEFWAYRHVREIEARDEKTGQIAKRLEFSLAGRSASFFPFGGGIGMCPGRNFAKPEVLLAAAMIVSRFEVEFVQWLKPDGSASERPAQDDKNYANSVAAVPDREMKVRWRRIR